MTFYANSTWAGEPSDDGTKNQDCTFLLYGGRYFDANCKGKHGFICERYADGLAAVYGIYLYSSQVLLFFLHPLSLLIDAYKTSITSPPLISV